MTRFNFKGDLECMKDCQIEFIGEVLEKRGYKKLDVLIENVGEAGENFIASVKRMVVNKNGESFKMIGKVAPELEILRTLTSVDVLFSNEYVIYTMLLPKFTKIQQSVGVVDKDLFKFAACFGFYSEAPNELILLEDLTEHKYNKVNRFEPLTNDSVKIVLKNFAIYHSLSFVLKHQEHETFEAIKSKLVDMYDGIMSDFPETTEYFVQIEAKTLKVLDDDKYRNVVKNSIRNLQKLMKDMNVKQADSPYLVIQHGDGTINNFMFKSKDNVPVECVFIDYQMAKANKPVYDIMYMLFGSTNYEQRRKHFREFIDYYHNELVKSLNIYGLQASDIYPREQLDKDLREFGNLMFAVSIHVTSYTTKKTDDAMKMKDAFKNRKMEDISDFMKDMLDIDPETVALYKSKIEELVDSFIELGLLEIEDI